MTASSTGSSVIMRHVPLAALTVCPYPQPALFSQVQPSFQPAKTMTTLASAPSANSEVRDEILSTPEANAVWKQFQQLKRDETQAVADMYRRPARYNIMADMPFNLTLPNADHVMVPPPAVPTSGSANSGVRDVILSTPEANAAWKQFQQLQRDEIQAVADMYRRLARYNITADMPFNLMLPNADHSCQHVIVPPPAVPTSGSVLTWISVTETRIPAGKSVPATIMLDLAQVEHKTTVKVKSVRWMGNDESKKLACATIVDYDLDNEEVKVKREHIRRVLGDVKNNEKQVQIEIFAARNAERRKMSASSHVNRMRKAQAVPGPMPAPIAPRCTGHTVAMRSVRRSSYRSQPVCLGAQPLR